MIPLIIVLASLANLMPPNVIVASNKTYALTYKIYYGPASGTYTNTVNAGTNTQASLLFPSNGVRYIAVVSVNPSLIESDFSNEVVVTNQNITILWDAPAATNVVSFLIIMDQSTNLIDWTRTTNATSIVMTNPLGANTFYRFYGGITNTTLK